MIDLFLAMRGYILIYNHITLEPDSLYWCLAIMSLQLICL